MKWTSNQLIILGAIGTFMGVGYAINGSGRAIFLL